MMRVFGANYEVELQLYAPEVEVHTFRPAGLSPRRSLSLRIEPRNGNAWVGDFFGDAGPAEWVSTPDPNHLLVVVGGTGYWVDAADPSKVHTIAGYIRSIHPAVLQGLLLIAGFSEIEAFDGAGERIWRSANLASDGFTDVNLGNNVVTVRGFNPQSGTDVQTALRIEDGHVLSRSPI
jgi:hypothetical protein